VYIISNIHFKSSDSWRSWKVLKSPQVRWLHFWRHEQLSHLHRSVDETRVMIYKSIEIVGKKKHVVNDFLDIFWIKIASVLAALKVSFPSSRCVFFTVVIATKVKVFLWKKWPRGFWTAYFRWGMRLPWKQNGARVCVGWGMGYRGSVWMWLNFYIFRNKMSVGLLGMEL